MVAGAAPGLQIRVSGRRTFRGVFDSHASPPSYEQRTKQITIGNHGEAALAAFLYPVEIQEDFLPQRPNTLNRIIGLA